MGTGAGRGCRPPRAANLPVPRARRRLGPTDGARSGMMQSVSDGSTREARAGDAGRQVAGEPCRRGALPAHAGADTGGPAPGRRQPGGEPRPRRGAARAGRGPGGRPRARGAPGHPPGSPGGGGATPRGDPGGGRDHARGRRRPGVPAARPGHEGERRGRGARGGAGPGPDRRRAGQGRRPPRRGAEPPAGDPRAAGPRRADPAGEAHTPSTRRCRPSWPPRGSRRSPSSPTCVGTPRSMPPATVARPRARWRPGSPS